MTLMKHIPLSRPLLVASGLLFAGFLACGLAYKAIGQRIDPDGTLREPFFLIPSSAALLLASSASLVGAGITAAKRKT